MAVYFVIVVGLVLFFIYMIYMPGESYRGPLPTLTDQDRDIAERLRGHVVTLCENPNGRNYYEKQGLNAARNYIATQFSESGYEVNFHEYQIDNDTYANIEVELHGATKPDEVIVVGAHYDSVIGARGADDNASGVAAVLELARRFKGKSFSRSVRFVAFVNEEPPFFMTRNMGSYVYAEQASDSKQNIIAMFSLEMLGFFSDEPGSQNYTPPLNFFYPDKGNFIAFVGNLASRSLVTRALFLFRQYAAFPSEGIAAPALLPGVSWSDHRSFWKHGFPAIMLTDTAFYRNPYYHTSEDRPETLNYEKMAYVVNGIEKMLETLLNEK